MTRERSFGRNYWLHFVCASTTHIVEYFREKKNEIEAKKWFTLCERLSVRCCMCVYAMFCVLF